MRAIDLLPEAEDVDQRTRNPETVTSQLVLYGLVAAAKTLDTILTTNDGAKSHLGIAPKTT